MVIIIAEAKRRHCLFQDFGLQLADCSHFSEILFVKTRGSTKFRIFVRDTPNIGTNRNLRAQTLALFPKLAGT
jgi:hypothetical protein